MPRHGKFDAVALLHRSAHTSVWSARPAGAATAAPNHCLKLLELTDHELADRDATAAEHLLVGAALQQAMADKSDGWAPVYELGSDDGTEAFYVTKLYPRSAQSMIDGRAHLSTAELRTILLGVVDALLDLDGAYHRPHANLKPSNVLIGEQVRPGQVVLTDPGALAENVPSLTRAPDPKAVGQLLYALVTHRPPTGGAVAAGAGRCVAVAGVVGPAVVRTVRVAGEPVQRPAARPERAAVADRLDLHLAAAAAAGGDGRARAGSRQRR